MAPESSRHLSRWNRTAIWLAVLLILNIGLAVTMMVVLPRQKRVFDEFNMQLPWLTQFVIEFGSLYSRFWWLVLPTQLSATVVGVILGRHAFHRPTVGTVFAILILAVTLLSIFIVCLCLSLGMLRLTEGQFK